MLIDNVKFLGIILDKNLSWAPHIVTFQKRLNSLLYLMRSLKGKVPTDTLIMVYYGKFHSLLSYVCTVWGLGVGWENIFISQKKALKILNGKEYENGIQKIRDSTFPMCVYL